MNDRAPNTTYGPDNPHQQGSLAGIGWEYVEKGKHQICVKVIDVFGVDTTTVVEINA